MTAEDDVPIKIKHSDTGAIWHRRPAFFWKPVALIGAAAFFLALPFIMILIILLNFWGWVRGDHGGWSVDDVEQYLRSIINTNDDTQLSCLMDDLECVFLYRPLDDPFLESIRLRCQENVDRSGWGGPGGFVDREGLRLILEDVQSFQQEQQTS
ncbi:MAG: hypothetical protein CMI60_08770 [Parvibaculum sp.]|nr:hypothetical protein [Parvibaculum sp.]|tara:strand:+ start:2565 stop:3026 length:462 start_codon:yes stop_codon:yes gene_type:complete